jgi:redox-sensing transcriptional repressor
VEKGKITKAMLGRLPGYLAYLRNIYEQDVPFVSATRIASALSLGEVQVRKDLNAVCGQGKPKLGYSTEELLNCIENRLGQNSLTPAVLVGAGRLGKALLEYDEFEKYGVKIVAAFDCNERILKLHWNMELYPMTQFGDFCRINDVKIGIITVGEGSAQSVCDQMVESGIKAIWNFAPCRLNVPEDVVFLQENLAISLAYLNNKLLTKQQKETEYEY